SFSTFFVKFALLLPAPVTGAPAPEWPVGLNVYTFHLFWAPDAYDAPCYPPNALTSGSDFEWPLPPWPLFYTPVWCTEGYGRTFYRGMGYRGPSMKSWELPNSAQGGGYAMVAVPVGVHSLYHVMSFTRIVHVGVYSLLFDG
ncbi:MAG: hypothetical protein Q9194_005280, partial [Teloschistes cf. exilis]